MLFDRLLLWEDPIPRPGPENMAVDAWLLKTVREPVLRVYQWDGEWVSFGYFGRKSEAERLAREGGARLVRRATGGGIVDHRIDRTYTLAIPRGFGLPEAGATESYRAIHSALARAMGSCGLGVRLLLRDEGSDSAACFEKPVAWDVVDASGRKVAGAGQRRTRQGLLHQGSVVVPGSEPVPGLFPALARELGGVVARLLAEPPDGELAGLRARFEDAAWLNRR